jgi:flagellar biosynthesis protein FlhG
MPRSAAMDDRTIRVPTDQAQGLRRLFAGRRLKHLVLVTNPHVPAAGALLGRLADALGVLGCRTLVVDAADTAPEPNELAAIDLAAAVESPDPRLAYLAARGLPLRHVDARGSAAALVDRLAAAAPQADVMLWHAGAADLVRLFGARLPRVLLLAGEAPDSVTHAYAALKLLALRCALMSFDLLLAAPRRAVLGERIAERLASCADGFLGVALNDRATLDPAAADALDDDALQRVLRAQLLGDDAAAADAGRTAALQRARPARADRRPN